jgi:hypothetical protein
MQIISRKAWGARRPRCRTPQDPRNVRELFIHWPGQPGIARESITDHDDDWCALPDHLIDAAARITGPAAEAAWMREIQAFHMGPDRGWCDFAYSFAVFKSGRIYRGRGFYNLPAGQEGHNTGTVAVVCVLGTADAHVPEPMAHALKDLVHWAETRRAHRELAVRPHRSVNQTTCPGDALARFVPTLDRV